MRMMVCTSGRFRQEVPISFQKRIYGESKRRLIPFIIDYIKSLIRFTFMRYPLLRNIILYGVVLQA